jgi:hypothetical protein
MLFSRRAALTAALAGLALPARAQGLCLVTVNLDGRPARLILDTGAARTILTESATRRLHLKRDLWVDTELRGAGGRLERLPNADITEASLDGVPLYQTVPNAPLSLAVTATQMGAADGLLGGDVLRHFTLHLAAGQLTLSHNRPAGYPLQPLWPNRLLAPVTLDGVALTALVDTGATASLLNAKGLHRLGLTPAEMAQDPAGSSLSIGGRVAVRAHQFRQLRVGNLVVPTPTILTAPVPELAFDMILGLDVLALRPLTLSYAGLSLALG